jgi:hemerythrin-like domain-containing protein
MITATQNLKDDHAYILRLIDVMEIMTNSSSPIVSDLKEVVELIKSFADGLHHAKEELLLFPLMAQRGFSTQQGPIAVMLNDHSHGREYVKAISESIKLFNQGDISSLTAIFLNMQGYSELLRNHIAKENNVLFKMADNAISEDDQAFLVLKFEEIENNGQTGKLKSDYIKRIEKLEKDYLPRTN